LLACVKVYNREPCVDQRRVSVAIHSRAIRAAMGEETRHGAKQLQRRRSATALYVYDASDSAHGV